MKNNEDGLTLIEVLVACTIVSIVIFIIYITFSQITQAIERNRIRIDLHQEARVIFNRMEKEISSAFFSKNNINLRLIGENFGQGEADKDRLDFICTLNPLKIDARESDLMQISYYMKHGSNSKIGSLIRSYKNLIDDTSEKGEYEQILGQDIKGINFRYFDGSDWQDSWDTNKKPKLPDMVEIKITFFDYVNNADYPLTTTVALPLAQIIE